jgi:hypothetical protein
MVACGQVDFGEQSLFLGYGRHEEETIGKGMSSGTPNEGMKHGSNHKSRNDSRLRATDAPPTD